MPDARALLRLGRAMVDLYCESFHQVPGRITLDIDDTFTRCMAASNCVCCGLGMLSSLGESPLLNLMEVKG
jgi:hypothetical protein